MNNHEMARRYKEKSKLIGKDILDYRLLEDDRVKLVGVKDKDDTGRLVIPSFITDFSTGNEVGMQPPLYECRYSEVYVDNKKGRWLKADYLCSEMRTDRLKLEFKHSECINSLHGLFKFSRFLKEVDISNLDTSNVTDMCEMFCFCERLDRLDLRGTNIITLDTNNVVDMSHMFSWCKSLRDIDISKLNTKNVVDMNHMFSYCDILKVIKLGCINTSKVVRMDHIFDWCNNIRELDLSGLDTRNVENMSGMFSGCESLEYINLDGIDTSKVIDMSSMFDGCIKLVNLDLKSLDIRNVRKKVNMFYGVDTGRILGVEKFNGWDTEKEEDGEDDDYYDDDDW